MTDQQVFTSRQTTQSQWLTNKLLHRSECVFDSLRETDGTSRYLTSRSMHLLSRHVTVLDLAIERGKTWNCTCVFWLHISVHDMFSWDGQQVRYQQALTFSDCIPQSQQVRYQQASWLSCLVAWTEICNRLRKPAGDRPAGFYFKAKKRNLSG